MYILCDLTGLPRAYAALTLAPFGYRSYYFQLFRNAQLAVQFRPQRVNCHFQKTTAPINET